MITNKYFGKIVKTLRSNIALIRMILNCVGLPQSSVS